MKLAYYLFLEFCSRRYESFSQAISFSANLPNFNPAMSKFNSFARNSQTSQSKTFRINSVPDSSEIMYVTYQVRHDLTLINEIAHVFNRKMSNQVKCSPRNETISMLQDTYYPNCLQYQLSNLVYEMDKRITLKILFYTSVSSILFS